MLWLLKRLVDSSTQRSERHQRSEAGLLCGLGPCPEGGPRNFNSKIFRVL